MVLIVLFTVYSLVCLFCYLWFLLFHGDCLFVRCCGCCGLDWFAVWYFVWLDVGHGVVCLVGCGL